MAMCTQASRDRGYQASSRPSLRHDGALELGTGLDARITPDDRIPEDGSFTDVGAGVDHAALDARARTDVRARTDRRERAERRAGPDGRVAKQDRRDDRGSVGHRLLIAHDGPVNRCARAPGENVEVCLQVPLGGADVEPVRIGHEAEDRRVLLQERREQLLLELPELVGRNLAQNFRLKDVRAGVDVPRDELGWFLQECFDALRRVERHQTVRAGVVDRREDDRHGSALRAVEVDRIAEVEVGQHVAVQHDGGPFEVLEPTAHCAGGSERLVLGRDAQLDAEQRAHLLSERREVLGEVAGEERRVGDPIGGEQPDLMLEKRPVADGKERLRDAIGQRPQSRTEPAGEDERLHPASRIPGSARESASRHSGNGSNPSLRQPTPSSGAYGGRAAARGVASFVATARTTPGSRPAPSRIARAKSYRETAPAFATWNIPGTGRSASASTASARSPVQVGDPTWSSTTSSGPRAAPRRMLATKFFAGAPVAVRAP